MKLPQILLILLILLPNVAPAANINYMVTVTGCDGTADQEQINAAINQVAEAGGGTVTLPAGLYYINGPIIVHSNIVLSGDKDAIVLVDEHSTQWFSGSTGLITTGKDSKGKYETIKHVEIRGFEINGNIGKLPSGYADSRSDTSHDCEKAILLAGSSGSFMEDIIVHDMYIHDTFSDGVYMRYVTGAAVYNMKISNCQHECVYMSVAHKSTISYCQLAGICSDNLRLDNCDTCKVSHNICFSYNGESYGQYKHGENAIQIGDAGSSHGYNAKKVGFPTRNIEVCDNTFSDPGLKTVWLHGGENVYVHDNKYVDAEKLVTSGTSVDLTERGQHIDFTDNGEPISYDNPPSEEKTQQVFHSIFDFLNIAAYTSVGVNDTVILPEHMDESSMEAHGSIMYLKNGANTTTLITIQHTALNGVSEVRYEVDGKQVTHTLMMGEKTAHGIIFTETSIWDGSISHIGDSLQIPEYVPADHIKIICITPKNQFTPQMEVSYVTQQPCKFHPAAIVIVISFFIAYLFYRMSKRYIA